MTSSNSFAWILKSCQWDLLNDKCARIIENIRVLCYSYNWVPLIIYLKPRAQDHQWWCLPTSCTSSIHEEELRRYASYSLKLAWNTRIFVLKGGSGLQNTRLVCSYIIATWKLHCNISCIFKEWVCIAS